MTEQKIITADRDMLVVRLSDSVTIIRADCRDVLPVRCAAVVTSPPYYNAREYSTWGSYDDFLLWCGEWIRLCVNGLDDGRMLCVNSSPVIVPRVSRNRRSLRHNIPGDLWAICKNAGMWFAEELTWEKPEGAAVNRNQRFFLDRHPMQWRANPTTERILVCQKPTKRLNDDIIRRQDTTYRITGDYERGEVWRMNPGASSDHPAPFPVELPKKLVEYYTWPSETVCDPFMGSGTTGVACIRTMRHFVGIERDPSYFEVARERLENELLVSIKRNAVKSKQKKRTKTLLCIDGDGPCTPENAAKTNKDCSGCGG